MVKQTIKAQAEIFNDNMACICVAEIRSRIKWHHVYAYKYVVGEVLSCTREIQNRYSQNAIAVNAVTGKGERNKNKLDIIVGHISEALSEVLASFMDTFNIHSITATINGQHRRAPEGTWVPGGGIEIPCTYKIYAPKIHKKDIRNAITDAENL